MNSFQQWAVNQALGAHAADNLTSALERRIGADVAGDPGLTPAAVRQQGEGYVDELAEGLLRHVNPLVALVALNAVNGEIDSVVSGAFAKLSAGGAGLEGSAAGEAPGGAGPAA